MIEAFLLDPTSVSLAQFQAFLLILVRVSGIFERLPIFGGATVPRQVKVWLSFFIAAALFGVVTSQQTVPLMPQSIGVFLVAVVVEFSVGLLIGTVVSILFSGFQFGGKLIDDELGFSLANVFDPMTNESVSITGQLVYFVGVLLFLVIGGLNLCIIMLADSFQIVPLMGFRLHDGVIWHILTVVFPQSLLLAVCIAAPTIIVVTMSTVALGLVGKVVPEMNIFSFSFGVRVFVGLGMLALSMRYMPGIVKIAYDSLAHQIYYILNFAGGASG